MTQVAMTPPQVGQLRLEIFQRILEPLTPGRLLDLGAAHRKFSLIARDLGWKVTAVDARRADADVRGDRLGPGRCAVSTPGGSTAPSSACSTPSGWMTIYAARSLRPDVHHHRHPCGLPRDPRRTWLRGLPLRRADRGDDGIDRGIRESFWPTESLITMLHESGYEVYPLAPYELGSPPHLPSAPGPPRIRFRGVLGVAGFEQPIQRLIGGCFPFTEPVDYPADLVAVLGATREGEAAHPGAPGRFPTGSAAGTASSAKAATLGE